MTSAEQPAEPHSTPGDPQDENPILSPMTAGGEFGLRQAPTLYRDVSFWGMTGTQFLGAFNDNLFKQLLLLISVTSAAAISAGKTVEDWQGIAMLVFAAPFLLFSGIAGFLSDRVGKRGVIIGSKVAEIVVMTLGMGGFVLLATSERWGYFGLLCVLFLMGSQSAFFGPGKYGILPEMLHKRDLPRANGIILMTTFLAIIFGTALAGLLSDEFAGRLWMGSLVCMGIAVLGTVTSLLVRRVPAARPDLRFQWSALTVPGDIQRLLRSDRQVLAALFVSSVFWMVAGICQPAVNALGIIHLGVNDKWTSFMVASIGLGIALGSALAGVASRERINFGIVRAGAWGIVACLSLLSLYWPSGRHVLGYRGSLPTLILLGVFTGMFAVPLQVFLQARPPEGQKGRMIALMNQVNWIGILLSAVLYIIFERFLHYFDLPRSAMFGFTAVLMTPVAIFYRPQDEPLE